MEVTEANTNKEVGEAIKAGANVIEISRETEAGRTVWRIKATGNVAWGVCIAALAVAIAAILTLPVPTPPPVKIGQAFAVVPAAAPAVAALGLPTAIGAIAIAVAGGGVGTLNKLRAYKMEERDGKIILRKKGS
jgi:hypothetical protein